MSTRKTITLIPGATDVHIHKATDEKTILYFNAPQWPDKQPMYIVSGRWEIESVNGSTVNLVNHDTVIPDFKPFKMPEK